jgi:signal transduction histidine kinase/CheY-like chemotaxis protein
MGTDTEFNHVSIEEYNELLQKLKATEIAKNKLARELRTLSKHNEINKLNIETQAGLNKIINEEKQRQEMYVRLLLKSCPEIIFIFDENQKFLLGTNSITNIINIGDVSFLHGRELDTIIERFRPPAFSKELISLIKNIYSNDYERTEKELEISTNDNTYKVNILSFNKETGEFAGVFVVMHDITEIVKAKDMAERASRIKGDFLSSMSHEIRTPMNAIIGMTELALQTDRLDVIHEYARIVKQASAKLLSIINDILDFSKIERGKLEIVEGEYQLPSLLNDIVNIIRMRAVDSRLGFIVELDSRMPGHLVGDEPRIRQVLLNILGNAVKFTKQGFISLKVKGEAAGEGAIDLVMEVSDSGVGIKSEDIESIFDAYSQSDPEKNKHVEGTGLGLTITKNILEAMGGWVTVNSEYGKGSTFTVRLPQKVSQGGVLAEVEEPGGKGVLVYERRWMYANSIMGAIKGLGVECVLASNDSEFCEWLMDRQWPHVFIAAKLYENVQHVFRKLSYAPNIVLLSEFSEATLGTGLAYLSMPVHSMSVANLLNGTADSFAYSEDSGAVAMFTAPEARVLIVDDISTNLKVAEGLMAPYKMQIDLRGSGPEAIEAIRVRRYDVVFMDHKMPGMDGVEATLRIRGMEDTEPFCKGVPVIALTANAVLGMEEMFMQNGFNGFLSKPIDTIKLNSILKKWIPKQKQKHQAESTDATHGTVDIEVKGLDTSKGMLMSGGTTDLYLETLAIFQKDGQRKIKEIKMCLERGDMALFTTHVHGLRSACANIGADGLSSQAGGLEVAGETGDARYIESNSEEFLLSLGSLLDSLEMELEKQGAGHDGWQGQAGAKEAVRELTMLKEALEGLDAGSIDRALGKLQGMVRGGAVRATMREISEKILMAEYDEAISLVEVLLQTEDCNPKTEN